MNASNFNYEETKININIEINKKHITKKNLFKLLLIIIFIFYFIKFKYYIQNTKKIYIDEKEQIHNTNASIINCLNVSNNLLGNNSINISLNQSANIWPINPNNSMLIAEPSRIKNTSLKIESTDINNILITNSTKDNNISMIQSDNNTINTESFNIKNKINNNPISNIIENEFNITINPYYKSEKNMFQYFLTLKEAPKNIDDPLILKEKKDIFSTICKKTGKNITSIDTIYYDEFNRFGNQLIAFNKMIFYSWVLGIKKIIIDSDNLIYIRNNIYDEQYNLTIEVNYNLNKSILKNISLSYYTHNSKFFFANHNLKIENRFSVMKNEILKNLPKIETDPNDCYIHIRSGDIFERVLPENYAPFAAQSPLCFYTTIIDSNNFRNIYIISENKLNPIVDKLLNKYHNGIFNNKNTLEKDISSLAYAYNIIGSISSFFTSIIKLNDNLKNIWEYDIYQIYDRLLHLHHSLYNYPRKYTIYRMTPSDVYLKKMFKWTRSDEQINIMLNINCSNEFKKFNPNI